MYMCVSLKILDGSQEWLHYYSYRMCRSTVYAQMIVEEAWSVHCDNIRSVNPVLQTVLLSRPRLNDVAILLSRMAVKSKLFGEE